MTGFALVGLTSTPQWLYVCVISGTIIIDSVVAIVIGFITIDFVVAIVIGFITIDFVVAIVIGFITIDSVVAIVIGFITIDSVVATAIVATLILYCFPAAHCPLLRSPIFHGQKVS